MSSRITQLSRVQFDTPIGVVTELRAYNMTIELTFLIIPTPSILNYRLFTAVHQKVQNIFESVFLKSFSILTNITQISNLVYMQENSLSLTVSKVPEISGWCRSKGDLSGWQGIGQDLC